MARPLFRPRTNHQKLNPSRETVSFKVKVTYISLPVLLLLLVAVVLLGGGYSPGVRCAPFIQLPGCRGIVVLR
jgi:hypothetical protein